MKHALTIIAVLIGIASIGCGCSDQKEVQRELEVLQQSNNKLTADKRQCEASLERLRDLHFQTCLSVEELNVDREKKTVTLEKGKRAQCAGVLLEITKLDESRGWAYLKYRVEGKTRFSDRLWFEEKTDRSSLFIQTGKNPVLLSVETCENGSCHIGCRVILADKYICKSP